MDDEKSDTTLPSAQAAEADKENGASEGENIGTFKTVGDLYRAYERLQAEFTRRSQRLKTLEEGFAAAKARESATNAAAKGENTNPSANAAADNLTGQEQTREEATTAKNNPDGDFLQSAAQTERVKNLLENKASATFCKGAAVSVPPYKPRTLAEAGELAKQYLKYKGEF